MEKFLKEIINHHETTKIKIQENVYFCIYENINIKIRIDGHEQVYWLYIDGLYVATKIIEKTELALKGVLTLSEYAEAGAKTVVIFHQSRKGKEDYLESLNQHADHYSELTGRKVKYFDGLFEKGAIDEIKRLKNGEILVLKNVRAWDAETAKIEELSDEEKVRVLAEREEAILFFSNRIITAMSIIELTSP